MTHYRPKQLIFSPLLLALNYADDRQNKSISDLQNFQRQSTHLQADRQSAKFIPLQNFPINTQLNENPFD